MESERRAGLAMAVSCVLAGAAILLYCALGVSRALDHLRALLGEYDLAVHLTLQSALWLVIFASGAAVGISLLLAGIRRRRSNLVPGPTLYVLGAGLVCNGLFMLADNAWGWSAFSLLAGAALIWLEGRLDLI